MQFNLYDFIIGWYNSLVDFMNSLGGYHPMVIAWILFIKGAWIIFAIVFVWGMWLAYMNHIQNKFAASIKWSLLAIDVPKENLQSAKAVEHIFAAMWPFFESKNLIEKYIYGMFQLAFSLEIVSIGGYTQFIIRVPTTHRDIVEAAIYAQYPKAEISEVEDYAEKYKDLKFPEEEEYGLWGSEFGLAKPSPYPIRTYPSFEHTLTQQFADPMADLLELYSRIGPEEELWLQFLITPIKDGWKEEGYKIINKIIGAEEPGKKYWFEKLFYPFHYMATLINELFIYGIGYEPGSIGEGSQQKESNEPPNKMLYLTPEEKNIIEGITVKMSKIAYQTKLRAIYIAKKEKMNKPKGVGALIGVLQQFSAIDMNSIVPIMKTFTKANYFLVERRVAWKQNNILRNYINRSQSGGWGTGFVLNIEELATVFHFPVPEAMRTTLKQVEAKKETPPIDLPDTIFEKQQMDLDEIDNKEAELEAGVMKDQNKNGSAKAEPPVNLPM